MTNPFKKKLKEIQERQKQSSSTDKEEKTKERKEKEKHHYKTLRNRLTRGIPARFEDKSFSNYETKSEKLKSKVSAIKEYADNFKEIKENGQAMYLFGNVGNGKTHLAISTMKNIVASEARRRTEEDKQRGRILGGAGLITRRAAYARFIEGPSFFQRIRDSFDSNSKENQSELMQQVKKVPLLVWDDILAEKPSEWLLEQMHIILNYRYLNQKPTIFTSNMPIEHFNNLAQNREYYMGKRIFSRMADMCQGYIFKFDFEDKRLRTM